MKRPIKGWTFDKGAGEGWVWTYYEPDTGKATISSARAFSTLLECVNDAGLNGYQPTAEPPSVDPQHPTDP